MLGEKVGFEVCAQGLGWQIFQQAGYAIGPVVEHRIKRAAGPDQCLAYGAFDGGLVVIVEDETFQSFAL